MTRADFLESLISAADVAEATRHAERLVQPAQPTWIDDWPHTPQLGWGASTPWPEADVLRAARWWFLVWTEERGTRAASPSRTTRAAERAARVEARRWRALCEVIVSRHEEAARVARSTWQIPWP